MENQRKANEMELQRRYDAMRAESERQLDEYRASLAVRSQQQFHAYAEKVLVYRAAFDLIADLIVEATAALDTGSRDRDTWNNLERRRFRVYGYLGMAAPQSVMTALDSLGDHIFDILESGQAPSLALFAEVRALGYELINEIRKDVGIDERPIQYTGHR